MKGYIVLWVLSSIGNWEPMLTFERHPVSAETALVQCEKVARGMVEITRWLTRCLPAGVNPNRGS